MVKVMYVSDDAEDAFQQDLIKLAGHSPKTVLAYDVEHDPVRGTRGYALVSFGDDFDDRIKNNTEKTAELAANMSIALFKLREQQSGESLNEYMDKLIEEAQQELCATCPEADTCEDVVKPEPASAPESETDKAYTRLYEALQAYLKTLGN